MSGDGTKILLISESAIASDCFSGEGIEPIPVPQGYSRIVCKSYSGKEACVFRGVIAKWGAIVCPGCFKGTPAEEIIRKKLANGQFLIFADGDNCSGPPNFTPNSK
jgi:hypothetical protein